MRGKYAIRFISCVCLLFLLTDVHSFDGERKGFILDFGVGPGHTVLSFDNPNSENYTVWGLAVNMGIGYAPTNKSSFVFGVKSNVFIKEVGTVYSDWIDKMEGDNLAAVGAWIASPFVFMFAPAFRSHSLYGSMEYTYFTREQYPSFLFSGALGLGILYDRVDKLPYGGLGLSAGMGYEFAQSVAVKCDILYSSVASDLSGISILLTLKFHLY